MFLNHADAFAAFETAKSANRAQLATGTLVETQSGWRPVESLQISDRIATLDGGFAEIATLTRRTANAQTWIIPAGALGNCTEMTLSGDQYVAISDEALLPLYDAPYVLMPVAALTGFRGIAPSGEAAAQTVIELSFDAEELLYAQTGALIHVPAIPNEEDSFFLRLGYGETRAALALINRSLCAPDQAAA